MFKRKKLVLWIKVIKYKYLINLLGFKMYFLILKNKDQSDEEDVKQSDKKRVIREIV